METINIPISYPEEEKTELFTYLKAGLNKTGGDDVVIKAASEHMERWFKATLHEGYVKFHPEVKKKSVDKGFGDTVHRLISRVIKFISMNCGCDSRRKWLNKMFPYKPK